MREGMQLGLIIISGTIPSAVCLSMLFFGIRYNKRHFIGVSCCFIGVGLSFLSDLSRVPSSEEKQGTSDPMNDNPYPHALWGNLFHTLFSELVVKMDLLVLGVACVYLFLFLFRLAGIYPLILQFLF